MNERSTALVFTLVLWAGCIAAAAVIWFNAPEVDLFSVPLLIAGGGSGLASYYIRKSPKAASAVRPSSEPSEPAAA